VKRVLSRVSPAVPTLILVFAFLTAPALSENGTIFLR